jgi:hypothetical protein
LLRADEKNPASPARMAFWPRATHPETLMRLTLHPPSFRPTGFLRNLAIGNGGSRLRGGIFTVPASSYRHKAAGSSHPWVLTTPFERHPPRPPHSRLPWRALKLAPKQTENA